MNIAKSLYLGGKIIHANDNRLNYYSYKDLGLRCLSCGEPVHLRRGDKRQTHFAHFKGIDAKQIEECELRVSAYSNVTQNNLEFSQARGQKIEIFQEQFLDIIAAENPNFYEDIHFIKQQLWVKPGMLSIPASNLEKITKSCINWFLKSNESKNLIILLHRESYKDDYEFQLREQTVGGVVDFLQIRSSRNLLEMLVYFSISKAVMKLAPKKIELLFYIGLSVKPVKSELIGIIIHTPWIKALSHVNGFNKCE